jgi:hypothetical protein
MGILMNSKKPAFLEKLTLRIATCTYDTIFYRINLYKVNENKEFENLLKIPIYIELPKEKVMDITEIDISEYSLEVNGDYLVTLEHVKDLGPGYLYFCAGLLNSTYYRKTSQASWETAPVGISLSVVAKVEK